MSRDNTILVISVYINSKRCYMVIHVQAAENFAEYSCFLSYLMGIDKFMQKSGNPTRGGMNYTQSFDTALRIAAKMQKEHVTEYGIQFQDYFDQRGIVITRDGLQLTQGQTSSAKQYR
jgi:hypothetical protein